MPTSLLEAAPPLDMILYVGLPYAVVVLFFAMTIKRYVTNKYSFSSFSSQFLENRHHFWGSVPWHIGIISLVVGHGIAFLIPEGVLLWNAVPIRLWLLEVSGLVFAIVALMGLGNLILRRMTNRLVSRVTSRMDWVILFLLLVQVLTGIYVALFDRWGSSWFASVLSPYLKSLFLLSPDITGVADLPLSIKIHLLGAYAIFAVFPFTRLVHVLVIPNPYLWRRPQVVIFNRKPEAFREIRQDGSQAAATGK